MSPTSRASRKPAELPGGDVGLGLGVGIGVTVLGRRQPRLDPLDALLAGIEVAAERRSEGCGRGQLAHRLELVLGDPQQLGGQLGRLAGGGGGRTLQLFEGPVGIAADRVHPCQELGLAEVWVGRRAKIKEEGGVSEFNSSLRAPRQP